MRRSVYQAAATVALLLPCSCASSNLAAWADTRLASPTQEGIRQQVAILFIIPAVAWDVATFPIQLIGDFYPYGDLYAPDPPERRHQREQ